MRLPTAPRRAAATAAVAAAFFASELPVAAAPETIDAECRARAPRDLIEMEAPESPLRLTIAPSQGGELVSIRLARRGGKEELLYRGGNFCPANGFEGKAPILWPATGRTYLPEIAGQPPKRGWRWNGQDYDMPVHGFARDLPWRVVSIDRSATAPSVTLELTDGPATRGRYPFGFAFRIRYSLKGPLVTVDHEIRAAPNNLEPMPFSLGNHIAFALPSSGAALTSPATRQLLLDKHARPTGEAKAIAPLDRAALEPFSSGSAIPLTGYGNRAWARLDRGDGIAIQIEHGGDREPSGDPVRFTMWGDVEKGFFSPEPWWGKQNALATGDGLVRLAPGETFSWSLGVSVEDRADEPTK